MGEYNPIITKGEMIAGREGNHKGLPLQTQWRDGWCGNGLGAIHRAPTKYVARPAIA
jgi:hypothetical protein